MSGKTRAISVLMAVALCVSALGLAATSAVPQVRAAEPTLSDSEKNSVDAVSTMIAGLPDTLELKTVNRFWPVKEAFDKLTDDQQKQVSGLEKYTASLQRATALMELIGQKPEGNYTLSLIPGSADELSKWTQNLGEGNCTFKYSDDAVVVSSDQYLLKATTLPTAVVLDMTKPVYLEYEFEVQANDWDGGGGFYFLLAGTPGHLAGGTSVTLSNQITYGDDDIRADFSPTFSNPPALPQDVGAFKGCVKLDTDFIKTLKNYTEIYNEANQTLTVAEMGICSSWGSTSTVKTLQLVGFEMNQVDEVSAMIAGLPDTLELKTVNQFWPVKEAFDALTTDQQKQVSGLGKYTAALKQATELMALIDQTPKGDYTLSLIPESADELGEWTQELGEGSCTFGYLDNAVVVSSDQYLLKATTLPTAVMLDMTKPVYLEYEFEVQANDYDGGGGFYCLLTGAAGHLTEGITVTISNQITYGDEDIRANFSPTFTLPARPNAVGVFKGCVKLDADFIKTLKDYTEIYDEDNQILTVAEMGICSSWGSTATVKTLRLVGDRFTWTDEGLAAQVVNKIDALPNPMTYPYVNQLSKIVEAYDALTPAAKALVSNKHLLDAALIVREQYLASINETPVGETVIDYLPQNEEEFQELWVPGEEEEGGATYTVGEDGKTIVSLYDRTVTKYLEDTVVLDTTKPIYLQYEFTVKGNSWDGGGGLQFTFGDGYQSAARGSMTLIPGIGLTDISAHHALDYEPGKVGTFKGCVVINDVLQYTEFASTVYDRVVNTLTLGHITLSATWGSEVTFTTFKVIGTELNYDQAKANEVIRMINNLPTTITLAQEYQLKEAVEAFNALSKEQQALVTNLETLRSAYDTFMRLWQEDSNSENPGSTDTKPSEENSKNPLTGEALPYLEVALLAMIPALVVILKRTDLKKHLKK